MGSMVRSHHNQVCTLAFSHLQDVFWRCAAPTSTMNSVSPEMPASSGTSCSSRFIELFLSASGYSSGTSAGILRTCSKVKWACSCSVNQNAYARAFAEPGSKSVAHRILASFSSGIGFGEAYGPTVSTGQGAESAISSATEPRRSFFTPPHPCVPSTTKSISSFCISSDKTWGTSPSPSLTSS